MICASRPTTGASRSNRILLVALAAMTLFGSALCVYAAAAAQDLSGLSVTGASGAFSLNAAGGFLGTRMSRRGSAAAPWIGMMALCTIILCRMTFKQQGSRRLGAGSTARGRTR